MQVNRYTSLRIVSVLLLGFLSSLVYANSYGFKNCINWGSSYANCEFTQQEIEKGHHFEMAHDITINFDCKSHPISIALATENGSSILRKESGYVIYTVVGRGPLRLVDLEPAKTKTAIFLGECKIEVKSITSLPSINTISDWSKEAKTQAVIISQALDLFHLANQIEDLQEWSISSTEIMLASVERKITAFRQACKSG